MVLAQEPSHFVFHTYASPAVSVLARASPLGLNATPMTPLPCGSDSVARYLPVATFQKLTLPMVSPAARYLPSGLNAMTANSEL